MPIDCQRFQPPPNFATQVESPTMNRLALSVLCHNTSPHPTSNSDSSRVTSSSPPSSTSQRTSNSPTFNFPHHNYASRASFKPDPPNDFADELRLPPIDHFNFPAHPRHHSTAGKIQPSPIQQNVSLQTNTSKFEVIAPLREDLAYAEEKRSYYNANIVLPRSRSSSWQKPPQIAPRGMTSDCQSSSPRRRSSSQTTCRVCFNCGIRQTRQWVRGENHSWLCHSCGQFWRKNGYPRPRSLWNRPTFKRSSRKSKLGLRGADGTRKYKSTARQAVSSSFLNGKKMIQWEIRLPPLTQSQNPTRFAGSTFDLARDALDLERRTI